MTLNFRIVRFYSNTPSDLQGQDGTTIHSPLRLCLCLSPCVLARRITLMLAVHARDFAVMCSARWRRQLPLTKLLNYCEVATRFELRRERDYFALDQKRAACNGCEVN